MNAFETEPDIMMSRLQRGAMYLVTWKEVEMPFGGIVMLPSKMGKPWPVPSALFEHLDISRAFFSRQARGLVLVESHFYIVNETPCTLPPQISVTPLVKRTPSPSLLSFSGYFVCMGYAATWRISLDLALEALTAQ